MLLPRVSKALFGDKESAVYDAEAPGAVTYDHRRSSSPMDTDGATPHPPHPDSAAQQFRDDETIVQALLKLGDIYELAALTDENDPYRDPPVWSYPFIEGEGIPPPQPAPTKKTKAPAATQKIAPWDQLNKTAQEHFGTSTGRVVFQSRVEPQLRGES